MTLVFTNKQMKYLLEKSKMERTEKKMNQEKTPLEIHGSVTRLLQHNYQMLKLNKLSLRLKLKFQSLKLSYYQGILTIATLTVRVGMLLATHIENKMGTKNDFIQKWMEEVLNAETQHLRK